MGWGTLASGCSRRLREDHVGWLALGPEVRMYADPPGGGPGCRRTHRDCSKRLETPFIGAPTRDAYWSTHGQSTPVLRQ